MSYRVRVKEAGLPDGRVSIEVAGAVITALRVALRVEAAALSARKSRRGRPSKLERDSVSMSLVRVESGSGTLVWESEALSLMDLPREAFHGLIEEAKRESGDPHANAGMQKALLTLEAVFRGSSPVEWIEFSDEHGDCAKVDSFTVDRIKLTLAQATAEALDASSEVVGRLLELDLAARTFRIHEVTDTQIEVQYDDLLEPVVRAALKRFVSAFVVASPSGQRKLLSLEALEEVPDSRFDERRTLAQIIGEQDLKPLTDFYSLAMHDIDEVPEDEFQAFKRAIRRGEE